MIEFSHMVIGPAGGMVLADLEAAVINMQLLAGEDTRYVLGFGADFFVIFSRK
jgi:crotonobetainyl-CoA:carnitine CoA-transferase CaiB-like acyl-CoA transferase